MDKEEFITHITKLQHFVYADNSLLKASEYLQQQGVSKEEVLHIIDILDTISYMCEYHI